MSIRGACPHGGGGRNQDDRGAGGARLEALDIGPGVGSVNVERENIVGSGIAAQERCACDVASFGPISHSRTRGGRSYGETLAALLSRSHGVYRVLAELMLSGHFVARLPWGEHSRTRGGGATVKHSPHY